MTLEQIRIFLCVAELCHVTRAAEPLNMTQSAVSASIAALERQYDVKLFDRVGRGIALTEAGQLFVVAAERIMREAEAGRALLTDLSQEPRGRLRIWASQTIASYWLTPRMIRMRQAWPQVKMTLHAGNTSEVSQAVLDGDADLGFVEGDIEVQDLVQRVVGYDELLLVMQRGHPLARKRSFTRQDYTEMEWLVREVGSGTRMVMEQHLADMRLKASDLPVLMQLPTNEAILSGIRNSTCVSMLSWRSLRLTRSREFALRRVTWAPKPRRFFRVLSDRRRFQSRAVSSFLDLFDTL